MWSPMTKSVRLCGVKMQKLNSERTFIENKSHLEVKYDNFITFVLYYNNYSALKIIHV